MISTLPTGNSVSVGRNYVLVNALPFVSGVGRGYNLKNGSTPVNSANAPQPERP
jgi:hypothetical protein